MTCYLVLFKSRAHRLSRPSHLSSPEAALLKLSVVHTEIHFIICIFVSPKLLDKFLSTEKSMETRDVLHARAPAQQASSSGSHSQHQIQKKGRKTPTSQGRASHLFPSLQAPVFRPAQCRKQGLGLHNSWCLVTGNEKPLLVPSPAPVGGI